MYSRAFGCSVKLDNVSRCSGLSEGTKAHSRRVHFNILLTIMIELLVAFLNQLHTLRVGINLIPIHGPESKLLLVVVVIVFVQLLQSLLEGREVCWW